MGLIVLTRTPGCACARRFARIYILYFFAPFVHFAHYGPPSNPRFAYINLALNSIVEKEAFKR